MMKRMTARGRAATALAAVLALAFGVGLLVPASDAQAPDRRDLLPDLQAAVPDHVSLSIFHGRAFAGFDSQVVNRGEGPLEIIGVRPNRRTPGMRAHQVITRSDGSKADAGDVGPLRYVREPAHRYWHLDDVMRYELRRASDFGLVRSGTRRGYCLRDATTFPHYCGRRLPQLLTLRMGVGPTKSSRWAPVSEGQSFDITNVPTGRYWLIHRADPGGRYRESNDANNASSALIGIEQTDAGRAHHVKLTLVGACQAAERCDNPEAFAK